MNETYEQKMKQLSFGLLLLISFATFNSGFIIDQTVRWSNHFQGLMNGLLHVMVYGMIWCIFLLPWSLLVFALYRWQKWKRFRAYWVLAPAVLALLVAIGALITHPATPQNRFRRFAKTELPSNIKNLHFHFAGGGFADYWDTYYFETTPEEVERIIQKLDLSHDKSYGFEGHYNTSIEKIPGWPDFSSWEGAKQYRGHDEKKHWFYSLITNSSETKVYILVCCT